ncbi:hypothetical protein TCON_0241 [Astathelohania contejeani]|uniref:Uncharacterized protein n=1 Tax=Astathelohania contejeani TaxID=164912 RepID=A0ABQ7I2E9_9MICR|nr:hypothetical protein TCON_0241 [Thelohania contejeani]
MQKEIETAKTIQLDEISPSRDITDRIQSVINAINRFPKVKIDDECYICTQEIQFNTLHDIFRSYAGILFCYKVHVDRNALTGDFYHMAIENLFYVENFILDLLEERMSVQSVLEKRDNRYNLSLKDQLIATSKSFDTDTSIHINCEQDVESIIYKIFKFNFITVEKSTLEEDDIRKALYLLYRRKESTRFFRIFNRLDERDEIINRLAVLTSLDIASCTSPESVFKTVKETHKLKNKQIIEDWLSKSEEEREDCLLGLPSEMIKFLRLEIRDIDLWYKLECERQNWDECLKLWGSTRDDGTGSVDASMIDICIRNKKYDEGWLIFEDRGYTHPRCVSKSCLLTLSAIRDGRDPELWVFRLVNIVSTAMRLKMKSTCCRLADEILEVLSHMDEEKRNMILQRVVSTFNTEDLKREDEIINSLMRGFLNLCTKCKDKNTCENCLNYAIEIFNNWRKRRSGMFGFRKSGPVDQHIYSCMLGVCDEANHKEDFCDVCKKFMGDKIRVNEEIVNRLEKAHRERYCECQGFRSKARNEQFAKDLLKHFVALKK